MDLQQLKSRFLLLLAVFTSLFHIYYLGFATMNTWSFRIFHVAFAMTIIVLVKPLKLKYSKISAAIDVFLILAIVITTYYLVSNVERLAMFMQFRPTQLDVMICIIGVLLVLETTRRINGKTMVILAVIFILYGLFGNLLPQALGHRGYSISRIFSYLCLFKI